MSESKKLQKASTPLGKVPWYLWPNLLSLDAVVVATVWLGAFAECERVPVLPPVFWLLGLVVWLVYTVDRLLDARRITDPSKATPRHRFAKKFAAPLWIACLAVFGYAVSMVLYDLPQVLLKNGLVIALLCGMYLITRHTRAGDQQVLFPKEIFCGMIFALGTTYPVFSMEETISRDFLSLLAEMADTLLSPQLIGFALLCSLNCVSISVWEASEDSADQDRGGIVQSWPAVRRRYIPFALILCAVSAWLGGRSLQDPATPLLFSISLSAAILGLLGMAEAHLSKNLRRALADAALLTPLLIIPLMH